MEKEFIQLKNFLDSNRVGYHEYTHEPIHTSGEAARVRGVDVKTGVKALVFNVKERNSKGESFVLILVSGDKSVDIKKLRVLLGIQDAHLASQQEVLEKTGCEIGSVHPFGNLFGLDVYMDKRIMENEEINFSAGMRTKSIRMKSEDFVRIIKPHVVDIAK